MSDVGAGVCTLSDADKGGVSRGVGFRNFALWTWNLAQRDRDGPAIFAFFVYDATGGGRLRACDALALVRDVWGSRWRAVTRATAALRALCQETDLSALDRVIAFDSVRGENSCSNSSGGGGSGGGGGDGVRVSAATRAAAVAAADRAAVPIQRFLAVARRCSLLLLPTYEVQLALQRAVLGVAHWEAVNRGDEVLFAAHVAAARRARAWRSAVAMCLPMRLQPPPPACLLGLAATMAGASAGGAARVELVCALLNDGLSRADSFAALPLPPPAQHFVPLAALQEESAVRGGSSLRPSVDIGAGKSAENERGGSRQGTESLYEEKVSSSKRIAAHAASAGAGAMHEPAIGMPSARAAIADSATTTDPNSRFDADDNAAAAAAYFRRVLRLSPLSPAREAIDGHGAHSPTAELMPDTLPHVSGRRLDKRPER